MLTGRHAGEQVLVRLITYTLDDPARPGHGEVHRLLTSLLNPRVAPAVALVEAYHARWEEELTFDEVERHQRPPRPLRSQTPVGVIEEIYGLLLAHYVVRAVMVEAATTAPPIQRRHAGGRVEHDRPDAADGDQEVHRPVADAEQDDG